MGGPASAAAADGPPSSAPADFVPRPLTSAEREAAWGAANFYCASSGHEQPVALWILGPSAVGKSTLTAILGREFDIPAAKDPGEASAEGRQELDAVIVDGEFMRDAHDVWQRWVKTPDWRSAYPALKSLINKEKDAMSTEAAAKRKHLVIPQTLLNLEKGLTEVEELAWQGYVNHVLAVVAPLEDCQRRGRSRETATGKRYEPREFELSISAIPAMIANCNGRYQVVQALEPRGCTDHMDFAVLARGQCGASPSGGAIFDAEQLEKEIAAAIGGGRGAAVPAAAAAAAKAAVAAAVAAASGGGGSSPSRRAAVGVVTKQDRCLLRRASSPASLAHSLQPRPLTGDERHVAWTAANFYGASRQERPIALWVLGPPCVGKTTLARKLALRFGVEEVEGEDSGGRRLDAVTVDGDFMRDAHGVWRIWVRGPDWQSADHAMKSILNKEKDRLCTEAATHRKHLIIGRRLLDLQKGLTEIAEFAYQGYTNHVVGLVAPLEECERRALRREQAHGKRYAPHEFEQALASIPRMAAACNGRCELLRPLELEGQERGMDFQMLYSGDGGHQAVGATPDAEAAEASAARWQAAVEDALTPAPEMLQGGVR